MRELKHFTHDLEDVLQLLNTAQLKRQPFDNQQMIDTLNELGGDKYIAKWANILDAFNLIVRTHNGKSRVYYSFKRTQPLTNQTIYYVFFAKYMLFNK